MDNVKVGDIVWLKSGGPALTVSRVEAVGAQCSWFTKDDVYYTDSFPIVCLTDNPKEDHPELV